jgi:adenylate cyclase
MGARLRALVGGDDYPLEDFNLVGRGEEAGVRLNDSGVSRQHATIRREGTHFWLVDLGSANGSFVNEVAITTARVLKDGDRLQFGTSLFRFDQKDGEHGHDVTGMKTQVLKRGPSPVKTVAVTMLVGDIKGFTHLSSQLTPEQVANLLREWYAECNAIMKQQGAMIDKFIGDCVFAYWPSVDKATKGRAIAAARALRGTDFSSSPTRQLLLDTMGIHIDCRIGLHVGEVALGAMGKGINTALGDAVNVAFRIEGLTRKVDRPVLASAAFLEGWWEEAQPESEACGLHDVKGHPEKLDLYALKV